MPIKDYGVLKGKIVGKDRGKASDSTPHYEIHVTAAGKHHRIAVNVKSQQAPSEVLFFANEHFSGNAARIQEMKGLSAGVTLLNAKDAIAIDYVRSGLFNPADMKPLPATATGTNNDLEDLLDKYTNLAMSSPGAMVYAFGSRFGPEKGSDPSFGFTPEQGIHDIHMNQGNSGSFVRDDGVLQDGALFINLPKGDQWVAIFFAFQSQSFHTDDRTGHRIAAAAAAAGAGAGAGRSAPVTAKKPANGSPSGRRHSRRHKRK